MSGPLKVEICLSQNFHRRMVKVKIKINTKIKIKLKLKVMVMVKVKVKVKVRVLCSTSPSIHGTLSLWRGFSDNLYVPPLNNEQPTELESLKTRRTAKPLLKTHYFLESFGITRPEFEQLAFHFLGERLYHLPLCQISSREMIFLQLSGLMSIKSNGLYSYLPMRKISTFCRKWKGTSLKHKVVFT